MGQILKAIDKSKLYTLKVAINGFTSEARKINVKEIQGSTHKKRSSAREKKHALGLNSRYHQLAYCLMLGKRYDEIEPNRPLYFVEWEAETVVEKIIEICTLYVNHAILYTYIRFGNFNQEAIHHWLKTGENIIFSPRKEKDIKDEYEK